MAQLSDLPLKYRLLIQGTRTGGVERAVRIAKYMIGGLTRETLPGGLIPLEAFRAIVFKGAADTLDTPYARIIRGENRGDREANAA